MTAGAARGRARSDILRAETMTPPDVAADIASVRTRSETKPSKTKAPVRLRRWAARALLFVPPLAVIALDLGRRRARIFGFEGMELFFYFASCAIGIILWTSLTAAATRVRGPGRWVVRTL